MKSEVSPLRSFGCRSKQHWSFSASALVRWSFILFNTSTKSYSPNFLFPLGKSYIRTNTCAARPQIRWIWRNPSGTICAEGCKPTQNPGWRKNFVDVVSSQFSEKVCHTHLCSFYKHLISVRDFADHLKNLTTVVFPLRSSWNSFWAVDVF